MAFGLGLAETAKLAVNLSLTGNFTSQLSAAQKQLKATNSLVSDAGSRAFRAGQQIGTGIKRGVIIGVAGLTALSALFIRMAKEGQDAANVETIFGKAVANSTKVTGAQVAALRKQQDALLNLAGVDDELIKTEQTRLIQMGLTGAQVLKLTPRILDLSKATGKDLLTATLAVGKAAEGNATSLQKFGVFVDKAKFKLDPFGATLDAITKKFGGTTQALSGGLNVKLDVLREKLANVREEAGIKLLPALTRIVDIVGQKLVPAFGDFVQSILPSFIDGLNKIGDFLQSGGAAKTFGSVFATIKTAAPILQKTAEATFQIVKAAVSLFTSLPPEIQNLAVGAFAINKLTGGLVTNVVGGIAQFLAKAFTGNMNVTAGVVNIVGGTGLPGAAGAAAQAGGGIGGFLKSGAKLLGGLGLAIIAIEGLGEVIKATSTPAQRAAGEANQIAQQRLKHGGGTKDAPTGSKNDPLAVTLLDRGGRETGTPGIAGIMSALFRRLTNTTKLLNDAFFSTINALKNAKTDLERRTAASRIGHLVEVGRGSLEGTKSSLAQLRAALRQTHDPKTEAAIRSAIAKIERKLPGREFAARANSIAAAALRDGKLTTAETRRVKSVIQQLKDRGLPHAAKGIEDKVNAAKAAQVKATNAAKEKIAAAARATENAVKAKDLSVSLTVPVTTNVSIRDIFKSVTTTAKFGQPIRQG